MKKTLGIFLVLMLCAGSFPAHATEGDSYVHSMKSTLIRGAKNILTGVLEIPITIQEYHEQAGKPVVRHIAGAVDGTFQAVTRIGSGLWDLLAAFIPGNQQGLPVTPETLF